MENKELSPLARQLLGHANVMPMFTQKEFDRALAEAKAEIMAIAIQTTRQAIAIEREECARLAEECVDIEKLPDQIRQRLSGKPH
jgi:DNA-binding transcriptional regulator YiaG